MAGVHGSLSEQEAAEAQIAFDNYDLAHAEARFDYALTLDNENEVARIGLALTKSGRGKHFEALDLIETVKPTADGAAAHALIALNAGRYDDARDALDYAMKLSRKSAAAWTASAAFSASKGTEEGWHSSIASLSMALYCAGPTNTSIRMDRVAAYMALTRYDEALVDLDQILQQKPDLAPAHWNKAVALLSQGKWLAGMQEYDWRLKLPWKFAPAFNSLNASGLPKWNGENGRLLLVQEGGFGDTIMALRYLPLIENCDVTAFVPEQIASLVDCDTVTKLPGDTAAWDFCLPFLSLVPMFNIPPAPYLDPVQWRGRIPGNGKARMGIAWSAGHNHSRRGVRSVPLDKLVDTFGDRYELFSVQNHDQAHADIRGVHTFHFDDFADLAGLMQLMDVIVSIDTAAIHLAGALGRPAHLLLDYAPEWRWSYPWYESVKTHTQKSIGDWDSALAEINIDDGYGAA
jgi:tetratricopeptide (TPR) repeat protein